MADLSGFIFGNVGDWLFGEQGEDDIEYDEVQKI